MSDDEALLLETRIRFQMNDWAGALAALGRHGKAHRPSEAEFWRGRILMAQAAALVKHPDMVGEPLPAAAQLPSIAKRSKPSLPASDWIPRQNKPAPGSAYLMAHLLPCHA